VLIILFYYLDENKDPIQLETFKKKRYSYDQYH